MTQMRGLHIRNQMELHLTAVLIAVFRQLTSIGRLYKTSLLVLELHILFVFEDFHGCVGNTSDFNYDLYIVCI